VAASVYRECDTSTRLLFLCFVSSCGVADVSLLSQLAIEIVYRTSLLSSAA
jgi:hypothetical protein